MGQFRLKSGRHGDPTPYYFDNYEWHTVYTNPANGKWFREDGQGLYRDLHITNVEGTVYTFVAQEVGRPYTLTDMNGNRLFVDRGRLLTTFQVDTKGDDDLSNDEFIEGSFRAARRERRPSGLLLRRRFLRDRPGLAGLNSLVTTGRRLATLARRPTSETPLARAEVFGLMI